MKRKLISTLLLLTISTPAFAQGQAGFCKMWFTHKGDTQPAKSAAYEPGIDVHGNPVTPADVASTNSSMFKVDVLSFPLNVDLAKSLAALKPEGIEMKADMGMIDIHRNGNVTVDGVDISDQAIELCTGEKPVHKPVEITAPTAPVEPEIPLVSAPKTTSKRVIKKDDPALVKPTQTDKSEEIIWGQDY